MLWRNDLTQYNHYNNYNEQQITWFNHAEKDKSPIVLCYGVMPSWTMLATIWYHSNLSSDDLQGLGSLCPPSM